MTTVIQAINQMRASGASEETIARALEAYEEVLTRKAEPDPECDRLAEECIWGVRLEGRDARDWVRNDHALGGAVFDNRRTGRRILLSVMREDDGEVWLHGSISRRDRSTPTYEDMLVLHRMMGQRLAVQLFVPPEEHYTIEGVKQPSAGDVLHLWSKLTGPRLTPDFRSKVGTI